MQITKLPLNCFITKYQTRCTLFLYKCKKRIYGLLGRVFHRAKLRSYYIPGRLEGGNGRCNNPCRNKDGPQANYDITPLTFISGSLRNNFNKTMTRQYRFSFNDSNTIIISRTLISLWWSVQYSTSKRNKLSLFHKKYSDSSHPDHHFTRSIFGPGLNQY